MQIAAKRVLKFSAGAASQFTRLTSAARQLPDDEAKLALSPSVGYYSDMAPRESTQPSIWASSSRLISCRPHGSPVMYVTLGLGLTSVKKGACRSPLYR